MQVNHDRSSHPGQRVWLDEMTADRLYIDWSEGLIMMEEGQLPRRSILWLNTLSQCDNGQQGWGVGDAATGQHTAQSHPLREHTESHIIRTYVE